MEPSGFDNPAQMQAQYPGGVPPQKPWLERNWKWAVPAGCLGVLLIFAAGVAAILALVFGGVRSSDVYKEALARAQRNPAVVEALGAPIKPGLGFSGSIQVSGRSGKADIAIPISGPKGNGTIYAVATKTAGYWQYKTLQVGIDDKSDRIDLLLEEQ